jgi:hypothetical protein
MRLRADVHEACPSADHLVGTHQNQLKIGDAEGLAVLSSIISRAIPDALSLPYKELSKEKSEKQDTQRQ